MKNKRAQNLEFYGEEAYTQYRKSSSEVAEANDCSVMAVATACNVSYDKARKALRDAGRITGHGAYNSTICQAVLNLGFAYKRVELSEIKQKMHAKDYHCKRLTFRQIYKHRDCWPQEGRFLVFTKDHVVGYQNGVIEDWTENRQKGINCMLQILESNTIGAAPLK